MAILKYPEDIEAVHRYYVKFTSVKPTHTISESNYSIIDHVYLPISDGALRSTYTTTYESTDQASLARRISNDLIGEGKSFESLESNALKSIAASLATTAINAGVKKVAGGSTNIVSNVLGYAINPNTSLFYKGPGDTRQFVMNYKMVPRNEKEALAIANIVKFFKTAMLPSKFDLGGTSVGAQISNYFDDVLGTNGEAVTSQILKIPYQFEIKVFQNNKETEINPSVTPIHRFKQCALTNLVVDNSTEGKPLFIEGETRSYPATTTIDLTFKEIDLVLADQVISEGY